jgi:transcriptional regulator with XRE-family HTH domain
MWRSALAEDIEKAIRDLRHKLGLTQEQFAAKVGVTFSTVNRWENGKSQPSPLALERIGRLAQSVDHPKSGK